MCSWLTSEIKVPLPHARSSHAMYLALFFVSRVCVPIQREHAAATVTGPSNASAACSRSRSASNWPAQRWVSGLDLNGERRLMFFGRSMGARNS